MWQALQLTENFSEDLAETIAIFSMYPIFKHFNTAK